jgi:hypothetical protein
MNAYEIEMQPADSCRTQPVGVDDNEDVHHSNTSKHLKLIGVVIQI